MLGEDEANTVSDVALRVAMFTRRPAREHGGVERVVRDLTQELRRQHAAWTVENVAAFTRSGGLEAINGVSDIAAAAVLAWRALRGDYDVIFVHCPECLWGPLVARHVQRHKASLIAVWHGAGPTPALVLRPAGNLLARGLAWFRGIEERLALRANSHVAVHRWVVDDLRYHYGFMGPVTIAENALEEPQPPEHHETPQSGGMTAVWVGQAGHRKGLDVALDAMRLARKERSDIELQVAGVPDGPMTDGVTWLGVIAPDRMAELYARADVLLFPTRYEALSLTVLEAMRAGLPLIVSDAIPSDIVEDGRNGFVFHGHRARDYARALITLRDDPSLRQRIAEQNRRDAERFDLPSTARVYAGTAERLAAASR
ncbi:MAG: glycosyltransferase family 4 protein [Candidatus Dormibacteria bacterium]